jgi:2-polyprenyl-6-methoxyphenol hydroxylase-like FAD-dependent oxidoreductase
MATHFPVIILGAGPVGLALAADLGWRGVSCLVLEQTDGSIPQPKMLTVGSRTMEYCRRWGISRAVRAAAIPADYPRVTLYATALTGKPVFQFTAPGPGDPSSWPWGPEPRERCGQTWFDPILKKFAISQPGITLRHLCKAIAIEPSAQQVKVTVLDATTGQQETVTADYLAGCDGAGSFTRSAVGIGTIGLEKATRSMNMFFECDDLFSLHDKGPVLMFHPIRKVGGGLLTTIDGKRQWRLSTEDFPDDYQPSDEDVARRIREAVGRDFNFRVTAIVIWTRRHVIAERYRAGRVFLAGDAAHQLSNAGGFGMNTGIGDALDLSWKLEAAVKGWGGASLLDSYEAERRPIGVRNIEEARGNIAGGRGLAVADNIDADTPEGEATRERIREIILKRNLHRIEINPGVELGYRYEASPIIWPDGTPEPPIESITYTQTSRPGSRAPHVWVGTDRSILDFFGRGFTLIHWGAAQDARAIEQAARERGVPLSVVEGPPEAAAIYERKLVLVRPDGHTAWRGDAAPANSLALIDKVRGA